jgi:[ribosomal protein S18]-alanine N-acetyltransferase
MLVERDVEDAPIAVEAVLRAVAVMSVVVDDGDALAPLGEVRGGNGDVVHEAETHRRRRRGVVPRWPDRAEGGVTGAGVERFDGGEAGARRENGCVPRLGHRAGVGVDVTTTGGAEPLELVDVGERMDRGKLVDRRSARFEGDERVGDAGAARPGEDGLETGRPFRVVPTGDVLEVARVGDEQDRHHHRGYAPRTGVGATVARVVKLLGRAANVGTVVVDDRNGAVRAVRAATSTRAQMAPVGGRSVVSSVVERCAERLIADGVTEIITPALSEDSAPVWRDAGFVDEAALALLRLDLDDHPPTGADESIPLRRTRRRDWGALAALDARAFPSFWHIDHAALIDATAVTPMSRLRVAYAGSGSEAATGYTLTGLANTRGYVQRLAVDPIAQRRGIGRRLLLDGLAWLARHGARDVLVNTAPTNTAALALYGAHGFVPVPGLLTVLVRRA